MTAPSYSGVWILAEQHNGRLHTVSHELLRRGRELADRRGCPLSAVVLGCRILDDDLHGLVARGADIVLAMDDPALLHFDPEPYTCCMAHLIEQRRPEIVIAAATSLGRTLMPYLAPRINAGLTADCTSLDIDPQIGDLLQTRPAIGGNILATIRTPNHRPQMATVRPHSTPPATAIPGRHGQILRLPVPNDLAPGRIERLGFVPSTDQHSLHEARRVVVVGRGIRKADNLPLVKEFAAALGAALGATRDVVDRGWLSYPHQVGLSGKTISPELYIGVGVSGSIQHLAGMQTAGTIVAINKDPDAQLFKVADIGIVGDLFDVLPVMIRRLKEGKTCAF